MEGSIGLGKKDNVSLQRCTNVANAYQFKDLFCKTNVGMKFTLYAGPNKDEDGMSITRCMWLLTTREWFTLSITSL